MFYHVKLKKEKYSELQFLWCGGKERRQIVYKVYDRKHDERAILKGVLKPNKFIFLTIFIYHSQSWKRLYFCADRKPTLFRKLTLCVKSLYIGHSLDKTQKEITGTGNREKHVILSHSNMRHVELEDLKTVTVKITLFWNTAHCRLLFTDPQFE
jgi:hypothetical protein